MKELLTQESIHVNYQCDETGWGALHYSSINNHYDTTEYLISKDADVNILTTDDLSMSPVFAASSAGHSDIVSLLINSGANLNISGQTEICPLQISCEAGHIDVVKTLASYCGCDLHQTDEYGSFPLYQACGEGFDDIVQVQHGARGHETMFYPTSALLPTRIYKDS